MHKHLPVSGDLKSGIPADVLTPSRPVRRREWESSRKYRLTHPARERSLGDEVQHTSSQLRYIMITKSV